MNPGLEARDGGTAASARRDAGPADDLAACLAREIGLLGELGESLRAQRAAVATGDAAAVNANVEAIGRVILAIEEARAARNGLLGSLPGSAADELNRLEAIFGLPLPSGLYTLRAELRRRAVEAAREARINQQVLARSMEAGEAFLVTLFSAIGDPTVVYAPSPDPPAPPGGSGVLLNRRA